MPPLIGITCGSVRDRDWCPPIQGHRQTYIDSVVAAGGVPLLFPLVDNTDVVRSLYERLDGVLLAGGHDINPVHYGEAPLPALGTVDDLRDRVELQLARWAVAEGKPVFGICRGMQVLNVALGGTLYQDIRTQYTTTIVHDDSYACEDWTHLAHELRLAPDSSLSRLFGDTTFPINSLHHQSINTLAPRLRAIGWAPDGVIEAIEGDSEQFVIGVQCHPEALQDAADPRWRTLFKAFVESCSVQV
jgi:putative glutamine amidotransferase